VKPGQFFVVTIKAPIPPKVDFNVQKIKGNKDKQQYFTDNHYQWNTSLNFTEIPRRR